MVSPQPGIAQIPLKAGLGHAAPPGRGRRRHHRGRQARRAQGEGPHGHQEAVARRDMTIWKDAAAVQAGLLSKFPGMYQASDYAMKDEDGYFWFLGQGRRGPEDRRPQDRHHRAGGRPHIPPGGGRVRRDREVRPDQDAGPSGVRHAAARVQGLPAAEGGAHQPCQAQPWLHCTPQRTSTSSTSSRRRGAGR